MKSGFDAQKDVAELAMMPAKYENEVAQARFNTARAAEAEQGAADAKALRQQEMEFIARRQLSDAAKGAGQIATVADLPKGGSVVRASQAEDLEQMVASASKTLPPSVLAGIQSKIAEIRQKEAAAASSNASAGLNEYKTQVAQFEQLGNLAGAAALSESNYRAVMMSPERAMLPKELTGNYRTDAPMLRMIEQASQDSIKRAKLELDTKDSESKRRLDQANQGRIAATIDNLKVRGQQLKQDRDMATKSGGKYSPEAVELKKAQIANQKSLLEARNQKTFPPMPLDPGLIEVGKTYTGPNGVKYDVVGLDKNDEPLLRKHTQAAYTPPSPEPEPYDPYADDTDMTDVTEGASNGRYD